MLTREDFENIVIERDFEEGIFHEAVDVVFRAFVDKLYALYIKDKSSYLPKIVCLCGSSKFVAQMACITWALERDEGVIVLGLHLLPQWYPHTQPDHQAEAENKKEHFDELHKRKIDLADQILVVNIGGYIGESTRSEIEYAKKHGKEVKYLEPVKDL